ncbi:MULTISPECIES: hypothetical protein [unclassified Microcystis]|jgi:hypothetical protein|uniref:hypothetical protein n=1 Tax=unclassified Microcystis TaxID=2643300 RepID=UPI0022BD05C2|nr:MULTISPECIES: hypothetical protein [unclassified Microcystis]MCZ8223337.1 hypothetical protein [Microcystis sp. LE19-84.1B]
MSQNTFSNYPRSSPIDQEFFGWQIDCFGSIIIIEKNKSKRFRLFGMKVAIAVFSTVFVAFNQAYKGANSVALE